MTEPGLANVVDLVDADWLNCRRLGVALQVPLPSSLSVFFLDTEVYSVIAPIVLATTAATRELCLAMKRLPCCRRDS